MRALIIDNHSVHIHHAGEIEHVLQVLGYDASTVISREDINDTVDAVGYDLLVLSGTSGSGAFPVMGNEDRLANVFALVRSWNSPIIGICYGCQILARAYGGCMQLLDAPITQQIITIRLTADGVALLGQCRTEYQVYSSHKSYISMVPDDFIVVAESDYGPEIIVHRTMPFIGVLFHPEHVMEDNQGLDILQTVFRVVMFM